MSDDLMSLACQFGRCQDCPDADECVCECHIDVPGASPRPAPPHHHSQER